MMSDISFFICLVGIFYLNFPLSRLVWVPFNPNQASFYISVCHLDIKNINQFFQYCCGNLSLSLNQTQQLLSLKIQTFQPKRKDGKTIFT